MQTILPSKLNTIWLREGFILFLLIQVLGPTTIVYGQTHLVKDINNEQVNGLAGPTYSRIVDLNGVALFLAYRSTTGIELWRSDGTSEGTTLVKDISPGILSTYAQDLMVVNQTLYFTADDGKHGRELWKSNGTTEGTIMVKEFSPGTSSTFFQNFTAVNDDLYFITAGNQVWKVGASAEEPVLVKSFDYMGYQMANVNGTLYFNADDGTGSRLWKSNGTLAGTSSIVSLTYYLQNFTNVNGVLYYTLATNAHHAELWRSDGTAGGTFMVKAFDATDIYIKIGKLTAVNNVLYFANADNQNGVELWKSDGTSTGTVVVKDIWQGATSSGVDNLINVNGKLYFTADNGTEGTELWSSDGSESGTVMVDDINAGSGGSYPLGLTDLNGILYFTASNGTNGAELWKNDGTPSMVKDIQQGTAGSSPTNPGDYLSKVNGKLYFWAHTTENGDELWRSDGTNLNTLIVKDIGAGTSDSELIDFSTLNNNLYFNSDYSLGWKSDGTNTKHLFPEGVSATISGDPIDVNGTLYFLGNNTNTGVYNLWKSDGTEAGTVIISPNFSEVYSLTNVNGILYFSGNDGVSGRELWKSNGTLNGTVLVSDIRSGANGSLASALFNFNGVLYFNADDGVNGQELWKTDGTDAGTVMVKDILPGSSGSNPYFFIIANNALFFVAWTQAGRALWKSDGTLGGTVLVKDIPITSDLININGIIFFSAKDAEHGIELWKSNGTGAGTVIVADIFNGTAGSSPNGMVEVNGMLFFIADDGVHGQEIWKSDGSEAGTKMVYELTPGTETDLEYLLSYDKKVFFAHEGRLWKSEGGECNTIPLTNLADVVVDSQDWRGIAVANNKLFFTGITNQAGKELFYYDFSNVSTPGCTQTITFDSAPSKIFGESAFDLTASASSGLSLSLVSSDPSVVTINGKTVTIVGAGTATITATQAGDINYASAQTAQTITINKASQTITFGTQPSKVFSNAAFDLNGSSSSGLELSYSSSNTDIATINGKTVTILKTGTISITARQPGNRNYSAAISVEQSLVINKASQTLTFASLPPKTIGNAAFDLSSTSTSGHAVTFTSSDPAVATINGRTVTIVGAGTTKITASQAGDNNYEAAISIEQPFTVNKKSQTITFEAISDKILLDDPFALVATSSAGLPVTFTSSNTQVATITGNTVTITGHGETVIKASNDGNAEYNEAASIMRSLVVKLITGNTEYDLAEETKVYPNPSSDFIVIENRYLDVNMSLDVIDAKGATVTGKLTIARFSDRSFRVDVSSLNAGVYLLKIKTGKDMIVKRIVKK
jgi:ELWxxDGT repeat protein